MPRLSATARAVVEPSPVTITTRSPSARSARTASAAPGFRGSSASMSPAARPSTATIILGGGTPKNFINQASVQAEFYDDRVTGHKFALQIVTDVPHFGGASGSSLEEAQSWGKLSIEAERVTVHADVTLALPMLVSALETTARDTLAKRKRPEFDPSARLLVMNGQPLADNRYQEP